MPPHPAARAAPITTVAAALGLEVAGRKARCYNAAAHKSGTDETPALVFFPDSNRFKCFACGVYGDAIDLVQAVRQVVVPRRPSSSCSGSAGRAWTGARPATPIVSPVPARPTTGPGRFSSACTS